MLAAIRFMTASADVGSTALICQFYSFRFHHNNTFFSFAFSKRVLLTILHFDRKSGDKQRDRGLEMPFVKPPSWLLKSTPTVQCVRMYHTIRYVSRFLVKKHANHISIDSQLVLQSLTFLVVHQKE